MHFIQVKDVEFNIPQLESTLTNSWNTLRYMWSMKELDDDARISLARLCDDILSMPLKDIDTRSKYFPDSPPQKLTRQTPIKFIDFKELVQNFGTELGLFIAMWNGVHGLLDIHARSESNGL